MNTCGTCKYFGKSAEIKYWDDDRDDEVEIERMRICGLLKHLNEDDANKRDALTAPAGVIDGSGYFAVFCVSEDFGCNQWAPSSADSIPKR